MYRARLPAGAVFTRLKSQLGLQLGSSSLVCIRWVIMWLFEAGANAPSKKFDGWFEKGGVHKFLAFFADVGVMSQLRRVGN